MNYLFLPDHSVSQPEYVITDARQIEHIRQVLQAQSGDVVKIAVHNTGMGTAQINSVQDHHVVLHACHVHKPPPPKMPLTLVLALPRPKVLRRLIQDLTAFGVARIVLMHSYQVEKSYWQSPFLNQLSHYMQLGLEQAGDAAFPELLVYKRFKPFVEDVLPTWINPLTPAYVAHPYATHPLPVLAPTTPSAILCIGPEGGFIPYEIELMAQQGVQAVHWGPRVLRTETAALVLSAHMCAQIAT